jgi:hypothetical protein
MRQRLLVLVCVERAAIGDVAKRLFLEFLVAAAKPVTGRERRSVGAICLGGPTPAGAGLVTRGVSVPSRGNARHYQSRVTMG